MVANFYKLKNRKTENKTWSSLFAQMELLAQTLPIVDYSLSQTSLEQVIFQLFFKFKKFLKN